MSEPGALRRPLDAFWLSAGLGLATFLILLVCAACTTTATNRQGVEMLALPGDGRAVPMPPAWMRQQIEQRMASGNVPGYVELSGSRLQKHCASRDHLLGCMVNLQGLKVTYVRKGLTADVRHMVLVHEYAHDLYDWRHD